MVSSEIAFIIMHNSASSAEMPRATDTQKLTHSICVNLRALATQKKHEQRSAIPFREGKDGGPFATESPWSSLEGDRKSTRLNFSHVKISYAVFCLKKKKNIN